MNLDYDEAADVLYISFGKPRPAVGQEVVPGDIMRYDCCTNEIVGITLIGFKERYLDSIMAKSGE